MSEEGSVSQWIADLKAGDPVAATDLWNRYFGKLVHFARKRLNDRQRRVSDEEDVAVSVFDTLCRGARDGRFGDVQNRNDLWRLLVVIVRRKVIDRHRKDTAIKRGGPDENHADISISDIASQEPSPEDLACMEEEFNGLLNCLGEDVLRDVASFKLEGYRNSEIAEKLSVSVRTIQRKLDLIEALWMNSLR